MTPTLRRVLREVSRSMYLSLMALPLEVRDAVALGYLFCRAADTIADTKIVPPEKRSRHLGILRGVFQGLRDPLDASREITDELLAPQGNLAERRLLDQLSLCFKLWKGMPDEERRLIGEVVDSVTEGMRMDLARFRGGLAALDTADELKQYCARVGGGPGVFWTRLCLLRLPALEGLPAVPLIRHGLKLGQALQITNILRDAPADLKAGRCYFPAEELRAAGLSPLDLLNPETAAPFRDVSRRWMRWALEGLDNGLEYMKQLPPTEFRLRASVSWPIRLSLKTLTLVANARDPLNPARRIKVSRWSVYQELLLTPLTVSTNQRFEASYRRERLRLAAALN